ncbi:hypothetical protein AWM70_08075 [Paenibacillus yonginensis]|uniref:Glycosyl hydrolases family 39 N-terminal catalytic domain-containing protein n=2 Tax=Paenibacillus yonginensis TaxID=1462996 RepID=A0A1B1MZF3_9BACL|nr:hypothetical protein AWM70_08075 [Paenibacillus yonginensis]
MTQFGIPKPAMLAYELLAKLGDNLIHQENGYVVTADNRGYQILAYNYCHFDDLYAIGDTSFISDTHRYNAFKDEKTIKLEIELKGIPSGHYRMITHTVNRAHGSSFDEWVKMGSPANVNHEDIQYLKAVSIPKRESHTLKIEEKWTYTSILEPHAISLVELLPVF